jgi:hypothetical protein
MASIHQVLRCNLTVDLSLDGALVVVRRFASSDGAFRQCGCSIHRVGARITGDDLPWACRGQRLPLVIPG